MNQGRIEQTGTPEEVFEHPAKPFVMDFLGNVNVFHGRVHGGRAEVGPFTLTVNGYQHAEPRAATAYVRPHELEIERNASPYSLPGASCSSIRREPCKECALRPPNSASS